MGASGIGPEGWWYVAAMCVHVSDSQSAASASHLYRPVCWKNVGTCVDSVSTPTHLPACARAQRKHSKQTANIKASTLAQHSAVDTRAHTRTHAHTHKSTESRHKN